MVDQIVIPFYLLTELCHRRNSTTAKMYDPLPVLAEAILGHETMAICVQHLKTKCCKLYTTRSYVRQFNIMYM